MTRKNIKVKEDLFERLKADKGPHRSWPQYLEDQLNDDGSTETQTVDTDTSELMDQLTRLDNRLDELPEQTAGKVAERLPQR